MRGRNALRMPTTRIEKKEATRQHLIDATVDTIAATGLADLTLAKVSQRAMVSRGLVNFHFDSKEKLLVETLKHLTQEYYEFWRKAVDKRDDPAGKLLALVGVDFHPKVCNRKKIAVFYAFWGEAKSRPTYREVSAKADSDFARYMEDCCRELAGDGDYDVDPFLAAKGLRCMVDGLWLELLLAPEQFDRDACKRMCAQYLAHVFPRHFTGHEFDGETKRPGGVGVGKADTTQG